MKSCVGSVSRTDVAPTSVSDWTDSARWSTPCDQNILTRRDEHLWRLYSYLQESAGIGMVCSIHCICWIGFSSVSCVPAPPAAAVCLYRGWCCVWAKGVAAASPAQPPSPPSLLLSFSCLSLLAPAPFPPPQYTLVQSDALNIYSAESVLDFSLQLLIITFPVWHFLVRASLPTTFFV